MQSLDETKNINEILVDFNNALPTASNSLESFFTTKAVRKAFKEIYNVLIVRSENENGSTRMDEIVALHFTELANQYNEEGFQISTDDLKTSYEDLQDVLDAEFEPDARSVFQEIIDSVYTYLILGVLIGAGIGLSCFFLFSAPVAVSVTVGAFIGALLGASFYSSFIRDQANGINQNRYSIWNTELNNSIEETFSELKQASLPYTNSIN